MIQMIYNDTSDRSGCHRKRAASEILMMTSSVMPWRRLIKDKREVIFLKSNLENYIVELEMLNLLFLKKLISEKEYEKIKLKLRKIYTN